MDAIPKHLASPAAVASNVRTERQAAIAVRDLEYWRGVNDTREGSPYWHRAAGDAIRDIQGRHPGAREHNAYFEPPAASATGERRVDNEERERSRSPRASSPRGTTPRRRGPGGRGARRFARRTYRASPVAGAGGVGLQMAGIFFGLTLLYLLLNERGYGPKGLDVAVKGITDFARVMVGPFDPLAGISGASSSKPAAAAGRATATPGSVVHPAPPRRRTGLGIDPGIFGGPPPAAKPKPGGGGISIPLPLPLPQIPIHIDLPTQLPF